MGTDKVIFSDPREVNFYEARTISWDEEYNCVKMIDQTLLPTKLESICCKNVSEVVEAIQSMRIRGAPAIGAAAAMGVALSVYLSRAETKKDLLKEIAEDASALRNARPTAANLAWGVDQVLQFIKKELPEVLGSDSRKQVADFVKRLAEDDVSTNKQLSDLGSKLFRSHESVLTHCKWAILASLSRLRGRSQPLATERLWV